MATSGNIVLSNGNARTLTLSWQVVTTSISGKYTDISWNLKGTGLSSPSYQNCGDFYVSIEGTVVYDDDTRIKVYLNDVIASGTKRIYHDGACTLNITAKASIYTYTVITESGAWELPSTAYSTAYTFAHSSDTLFSEYAKLTLPTGEGFTRTVKWYLDNVYQSSNTAGSTTSSLYHTFSGLSAGSYHTYKAKIYDGGTYITEKSFTQTTDAYSTAGSVSVSSKSESTATLSLTGLPTNQGFTRTVKWYYKKHTNSSYTYHSSSSVGASTSSVSKTISGLISGIQYDFAANIYDGSTYITQKTTYTTLSTASMSLSVSALEASATMSISGLINVGYNRTLKYYYRLSGGSWISAGEVTAYTSTTGTTKVISQLTSGQLYEFKAELWYSTYLLKSVLVSKSIAAMTGSISASSNTYSTINATLSGLYTATGYDRTAKWYYKKSADSTYILAGTTTIEAGNSTENYIYENLKALTKYNLKCEVYRGSTLLKTFTKTLSTIEVSEVAIPEIISLESVVNTKNISIEWIAPDDRPEMTYHIEEYQGGSWVELDTSDYVSPLTIEVATGNITTTLRIKGTSSDSSAESYSNEMEIYVWENFDWDSAKTAGEECIITAHEWNILTAFVNSIASTTLDYVGINTDITATVFNALVDALKSATTVNISAKSINDNITATDLAELKNRVNGG